MKTRSMLAALTLALLAFPAMADPSRDIPDAKQQDKIEKTADKIRERLYDIVEIQDKVVGRLVAVNVDAPDLSGVASCGNECANQRLAMDSIQAESQEMLRQLLLIDSGNDQDSRMTRVYRIQWAIAALSVLISETIPPAANYDQQAQMETTATTAGNLAAQLMELESIP